MAKIEIDAKESVLGRLGSFVAKRLLLGDSVEVYNSEEVIISGKIENIVEKISSKRRMGSGGSLKGPKYIRREDLLLKRMIRGMLPYDRPRGREAYKRLRCFIGGTENKNNAIKLEHKKPKKFSRLKEVVKRLK